MGLFGKKKEVQVGRIHTVLDSFVALATVEIAEKLQEMFNHPILINDFTRVQITLNELPLLIGNEEDKAISVIFKIEQELPGKIVFLTSEKSGLELYNFLMKDRLATVEREPGILDANFESCIESIASIFSMSFVSAISNLLNKRIFTSIPVISYSFKDAVINEIIFDNVENTDNLDLYISKFQIESADGFFIFIQSGLSGKV